MSKVINRWLIIYIILWQNLLFGECSISSKEEAIKLYKQAIKIDNISKELNLLEKSLNSCYSPEINIQISLIKGDIAYDKKEYKSAKNHYSNMLRLIDKIKDKTSKKEFHLLSYKSLKNSYKAMNKNDLASIMGDKYNLIEYLDRGIKVTQTSSKKSKSYALIIGINRYKEASRLSGAVADANALYKMLQNIGVDDITILKDNQATKYNIISSLEKIAQKIDKNDRFYMFFSGHGTSLEDSEFAKEFYGDKKLLAMMEHSGALVPYNFSKKNIKDTLIIGHRDLRTLFEQIDSKGAISLVVFDACFSGMTSRGLISDDNRRKYIDTSKINSKNIITNIPKRELIPIDNIYFTPKLEYPYKNLIYIASTSSSDWAVEDKNTNRGYLTQQIEKCLSGVDDYNRDNRIFKNELDSCLKNSNLPQAPQLYPQNRDINPLIIRYKNIKESNNTLQTDTHLDIYNIFELKGENIFNIVAYNRDEIIKKTFKNKEDLIIKIETQKDGYLALFSIDSMGNFYMIEPYQNIIKVKANKLYKYSQSQIGEPLGNELIKAILFYKKRDIERLKEFDSDREINKIFKYLKNLPKSSFQTASLKLFTYKE